MRKMNEFELNLHKNPLVKARDIKRDSMCWKYCATKAQAVSLANRKDGVAFSLPESEQSDSYKWIAVWDYIKNGL
jgi:hypothetical protein